MFRINGFLWVKHGVTLPPIVVRLQYPFWCVCVYMSAWRKLNHCHENQLLLWVAHTHNLFSKHYTINLMCIRTQYSMKTHSHNRRIHKQIKTCDLKIVSTNKENISTFVFIIIYLHLGFIMDWLDFPASSHKIR